MLSTFFTGSPPQVRGKPSLVLATCSDIRITPAGAGKTLIYRDICHCKQDHPRRCGENTVIAPETSRNSGSPPQVRGKRCKSWRKPLYAGITPAGAGKTGRAGSPEGKTGDHPRRCGENCCKLSSLASPLGSPPQVRGKLSLPLLHDAFRRITPAGAGKTS